MAKQALPLLDKNGLYRFSKGFCWVDGKRKPKQFRLGRDKSYAARAAKALYVAWENETCVDPKGNKVWSEEAIKTALAFAAPQLAPAPAPPSSSQPLPVFRVVGGRDFDLLQRSLRGARCGHAAFIDRLDQFTVRLVKNRYDCNELDKLKAGKIDFVLYAFADETDAGLCQWSLLDMSIFRQAGDNWFAGVRCDVKTFDHCQFMSYVIDDFTAFGRFVLAQQSHDATVERDGR